MLDLNKVYHGDCLKATKKLDNDSIDLIVVDPPYMMTNENWDKGEVFNEELIKELYRVLKKTGSIYIWCSIGRKKSSLPSLVRWFPLLDKYFDYQDIVTWKKQRGRGTRKGWLLTREEIMWFVKDSKKYLWNKKEQYSEEPVEKFSWIPEGTCKRFTNVWTDINEELFKGGKLYENKKLHPAQKPIKTIERIIKLHTKEDDIVYDCFAGSGTTAIACQNLNRNFILVELEMEYCIEICKRIIKNRNKKIKNGDGNYGRKI